MNISVALLVIAVALRGDRGLEPGYQQFAGTEKGIAVALRGDRGLEHADHSAPVSRHPIAVALRGDRGLERFLGTRQTNMPLGLRSLFGAIEDWNLEEM